MKRIQEQDYLAALKLVNEYREQTMNETQNIMGEINALPLKNDVIRIIKVKCSGHHKYGAQYIVKKAYQDNKTIFVRSTNNSLIQSKNYDWVICGKTRQGTINPNHINGDITDLPDLRIEQIGLSIRAYNCLKCVKVDTLHKIIKTGRTGLADLQVRGLGKKTIEEITNLIYFEYNYLLQ